jgi:hypothetical protein
MTVLGLADSEPAALGRSPHDGRQECFDRAIWFWRHAGSTDKRDCEAPFSRRKLHCSIEVRRRLASQALTQVNPIGVASLRQRWGFFVGLIRLRLSSRFTRRARGCGNHTRRRLRSALPTNLTPWQLAVGELQPARRSVCLRFAPSNSINLAIIARSTSSRLPSHRVHFGAAPPSSQSGQQQP